MKTVRVAAGIIQHEQDVLAVQRGYGDMAGLWEFPGGKIERGETAAEAVERELLEELQVRVCNLRAFYTVEYDYPAFHVEMECFFCELASDAAPAPGPGPEGEDARTRTASAAEEGDVEPQAGGTGRADAAPQLTPNDRQLDIRWVPRTQLTSLSWMPADVELAGALATGAVANGAETSAADDALVKRRRDSRKSMQGNKRANTKPELLVRQRLREAGLPGYRLQWKKAPGRPDIAYPGRKVAIFVNGCFWHRCPYCQPPIPKRNRAFWEAKFERNVARDAQALAELAELGWTAIVIWECELKRNRVDETMARVIAQVKAARRSS